MYYKFYIGTQLLSWDQRIKTTQMRVNIFFLHNSFNRTQVHTSNSHFCLHVVFEVPEPSFPLSANKLIKYHLIKSPNNTQFMYISELVTGLQEHYPSLCTLSCMACLCCSIPNLHGMYKIAVFRQFLFLNQDMVFHIDHHNMNYGHLACYGMIPKHSHTTHKIIIKAPLQIFSTIMFLSCK